MARSPSEVLTDGYKAKSAGLAEQTALAIRALWLRRAPYAKTAEEFYKEWLADAAPLLTRAWAEQATLARAYYTGLRRIEAPGARTYAPKALPTVDQKVVRDSLYYMAFLEGRPDGEPLKDYPLAEEATRDERLSMISGSVVKHAMNGGRIQIKTALDNDPANFRGYFRVLGADPCGFCALLATRHDYGKDSFEESDARFEGLGECKVHDECHCTLRPYWAAPALTETHVRADELWGQVKKKFPGRSNKQLISEYSKMWREQQDARTATVDESRASKGRAA